MNPAHLHLVFNHFPIIVPVVGLLVMIAGFVFRSETIKRVAYAIFILGSLTTFAAGATGEGAEEAIKHLPGIEKGFIHAHEEAAEIFGIFSHILGLISIAGLWASIKENSFANIISLGALVLSLVVLFFSKETGTSGGEIRHAEIRSDNPSSVNSPAINPSAGESEKGEKEHDKD